MTVQISSICIFIILAYLFSRLFIRVVKVPLAFHHVDFAVFSWKYRSQVTCLVFHSFEWL